MLLVGAVLPYSLSEHALLNASRTAADNSEANYVREWIQIELVNTPYSFCAAHLSSGLPTSLNVMSVTGGGWQCLLQEEWPASSLIFVPSLGSVVNDTNIICIITNYNLLFLIHHRASVWRHCSTSLSVSKNRTKEENRLVKLSP